MTSRFNRTSFVDTFVRPLAPDDQPPPRVDPYDDECASEFRRLVAYAADQLSGAGNIPGKIAEFVLHVGWTESKGGFDRSHMIGEQHCLSLFSIPRNEIATLLTADSPWRDALNLSAELATGSSSPESRLSAIEGSLEKSSGDLLAAQFALVRAQRALAQAPEWRNVQGWGPARYEAEAELWVKQWRPMGKNSENIHDDRLRFIAAAKSFDDLAPPPLRPTPPGTPVQPAAPKSPENPVADEIEDFVVKKPIATAIAMPALFSVVLPLLFKWSGAAEGSEAVLEKFALSVRLFAVLYFAGPALLVFAIATGAISALSLILLLVAIGLLLSTSYAACLGSLLCVLLAFGVTFMGGRNTSRLSILTRVKLRNWMAMAAILSFAIGFVATAMRNPSFYTIPFHRFTATVFDAASFATSVAQLESDRDLAAIRIQTRLDTVPSKERPDSALLSDVQATTLSLIRFLNKDRSLDSSGRAVRRVPINQRETLDTSIKTATELLNDIRVAEMKLVQRLAAPPYRERTAVTNRREDGTQRAQRDTLAARSQREFESSDAALKEGAAALYKLALDETQDRWMVSLSALRFWGAISLGILLLGTFAWITSAGEGDRIRGWVVAAALVAMLIPLIRGIHRTELNPLRPFDTFTLPSFTLAGLASDAKSNEAAVRRDSIYVVTGRVDSTIVASEDVRAMLVKISGHLDSIARLASSSSRTLNEVNGHTTP